jgi:hypothetical protein
MRHAPQPTFPASRGQCRTRLPHAQRCRRGEVSCGSFALTVLEKVRWEERERKGTNSRATVTLATPAVDRRLLSMVEEQDPQVIPTKRDEGEPFLVVEEMRRSRTHPQS